MANIDYLRVFSQGWIYESILYIALTVALIVVWRILKARVRARADSTATIWDDVILHALEAPLLILILALGGHSIVSGAIAALFEDPAQILSFLQTVRAAMILIAVFWAFLRFVNRIELYYRRREIQIGEKTIEAGALHAVFQTIRAALIVAALLAAMETLGLSVSGLLAFGGVGGIIIGFAAKDTLANFFSGLLIFLERPFVVGDWVRRPDVNVEGVVEHIGWRVTQIRTFDQRPLYVPNSLFFNSVIENPQRMTNRRIYEYMGVRYDDIDRLPALLDDIREMINTHDGIAQDKIRMVSFDRYGASSLDFFVYAMTLTTDWKVFHDVKQDVLLKIAALVKKHECEFAFPTRTLHHTVAPPPSLPPALPPAGE